MRLMTEFTSSLGRHRIATFARDVGLNEARKKLSSISTPLTEKFIEAHKTMGNFEKVTRGLAFLDRIHAGLADNGNNSISNAGSDRIPFISQSENDRLGSNGASYFKIHTHIGKPTSGKLKRIKENSAFIETEIKSISNSQSDYIKSSKRSQLNIQNGFNEKSFTFLLDDTYISVLDYYELFSVKKRFETEIKKDIGNTREFWGAALKTTHQFKIKNRIDFYTCHIKIHLLKIVNPEDNVETLLNKCLQTENSSEFSAAGKFPRNFQISEPKFSENNKITTTFLTSLNVGLKDSLVFNKNCKIIKTWSRSLSPGSILEFNLTHHLGTGICINELVELVENSKNRNDNLSQEFIQQTLNLIDETTNSTRIKAVKDKLSSLDTNKYEEDKKNILNHPSGYVFAFEVVGDRRASIINKANDIFSGYSPVNLNFEFKTELSYLCDQENENELLVYVKKNKNRNFNEESDFPDLFYPDREEKFHVNFKDIDFKGTGKKEWRLEYDPSLRASTDISETFSAWQNLIDKMGLKYGNIGEDGIQFDFKKDPTEEETESPKESPD